MNLESVARVVLAVGGAFVLLGVILLLLSKFGVTRLPGDIVWRRGPMTIIVPIGFSIVASIVLTVIFNLFLRR